MKSEKSDDERINLKIIMEKLKQHQKVKLKVLITEYYDSITLDRLFVFNFRPRLSIIGESDTLDDAKDQCVKALKFLLNKEAKELEFEYSFDDIELEMKIYY